MKWNNSSLELHELRHAWIMLVSIVAYACALKLQFHIHHFFPFPKELPYGQWPETPWGFITRDFVSGVCILLYLAVVFPIGLIFLKRCWPYSFMALWMAVLSSAQPVAVFIMILWHTRRLFDPSQAASDWLTFDAYITSKSTVGGWVLAGCCAAILPLIVYATKKTEDNKKRFGTYFPKSLNTKEHAI